MSKHRAITVSAGADPSIEQASALLQEYTAKIRVRIQRLRGLREEYLAAKQKRLEQRASAPIGSTHPNPEEENVWSELVNFFRDQSEEYSAYLNAVRPQVKKLAQHVSQLITHSTLGTLSKIELSIRVAELESVLQTAQDITSRFYITDS